jgi:hypothetical protein
MAWEERLETQSAPASGDLSAHQFKFVRINSSGQLALAGASGRPDGVLQDKPSVAGQAGCYATGGTTKCVAGAALAAGIEVTSDSSGLAVAAATGDEVRGKTLEAASGANSIIAVLLR